MDSVNTIKSVGETLGLSQPEQKKNDDMGMEQFLSIMVAQLRNQDPMNPSDSGEMFSQLTSFGTVKGITELSNTMETFAADMKSFQALQATTLVGRKVLVPSTMGYMTEQDNLKGSIAVEAPVSNLVMRIKNEKGETVRTMNLGAHDVGLTDFEWDGLNDDGVKQENGVYSITAEAVVGNNNTSFQTLVLGNVDSVTVGQGVEGLMLNLAGLGGVPASWALEIR